MPKNIVLTGGGTAGHIYPALALAERLSEHGHGIFYAGTPAGIEARIVPEAGYPYKAFESSGFDRSKPMSLVSGIARISASTGKARKWFREINPDVVVSFGGYVSIPVARAAEKCGVPVVVHEQNSVMGMANKYISKKAATVCLTYEDAAKYVPEGVKWLVTGNPVRAAVMSTTRDEGRDYLGLPDDATVLVVFGGSRGARHINEAVSALKPELMTLENLYVIHITGPTEYDAVSQSLSLSDDDAKRWRLVSYEDQMPKVLSAADAVVSRAGATSLAEIAAKCVPAILIPYPHATNDHQRFNANSYASSGAAKVVDDSDLDSRSFAEAVVEIASNRQARDAMRAAASALGSSDAAGVLAEVVEECAG